MDKECMIELICALEGHSERAWQASWNPEDPILVSCSSDKTIRLYPFERGQDGDIVFGHTQIIATGHRRTVRSIAWAPGGKSLASGSFDSTVAVWQKTRHDEWECVGTLEGHDTECKCVAYSGSGSLLASCGRDKSVWIWEVQPGGEFECLSVLVEHSQDVKSIVWHPFEEILASASYDNTINLYVDDPSDDWYKFKTLTGHSSTVWSIEFSPCGRYLASSSDDGMIKVWASKGTTRAMADWSEFCSFQAHTGPVYKVSWCSSDELAALGSSPSIGLLASVGEDGNIRVWVVPTDSTMYATEIAHAENAHNGSEINCVEWCGRPGMKDILVTAADDGSICVWRVLL